MLVLGELKMPHEKLVIESTTKKMIIFQEIDFIEISLPVKYVGHIDCMLILPWKSSDF